VGTKVFIGHGRSMAWRDLKDFIKDRLHLPYDEFNRVPVAGITNIDRLSEMLDAAAVAFVILTAEDEQADGALRARMNVIHEVGLFQGRLGFTKAIVLLEDGCEEFSNIAGLGQIRFPKANIASKFEEIRLVLSAKVFFKIFKSLHVMPIYAISGAPAFCAVGLSSTRPVSGRDLAGSFVHGASVLPLCGARPKRPSRCLMRQAGQRYHRP
jgi:hypothetical protein